jgi:hypothetical protein
LSQWTRESTKEKTFISMNCDAMIKHIRAPRSFHIATAVGSPLALRERTLHLCSKA